MADSILEFLRSFECLSQFSDEELSGFAVLCGVETLGSGVYLFNPGDPSTAFYVVLRGAVVILVGPEPTAKMICRLVPGEFFGEMGVIESSLRTASARTDGETVLLVCPAASFDDFMAVSPGVALKIMVTITRRYKPSIDSPKSESVVCSFCGKVEAEVAKLVAGPDANICDQCVSKFRGQLADESPTN